MTEDFYYINRTEIKKDTSFGYDVVLIIANDFAFQVDEQIFAGKSEKEKNQMANCIYMFLKKNPRYQKSNYWFFVYFENKDWLTFNRQVNVWFLLKDYPKSINDKINKIVENLSLSISTLGSSLDLDFESEEPRAFLPESDDDQIEFIVRQLSNAGLFDEKLRTLTIKGLERIEQSKVNKESKKIFIASQFHGFEQEIEQMKLAINEAGYTPVCMTDHQTNDYIMPEIFKQIKESIAIVGEISAGNNGVYFELGYAKGLGIETIVLSKKDNPDKITKAHFDIAQISMIYYENLDDLKEKLVYRIKSTL